MPDVDREALLERARGKGVNPLAYWIVRAILQPFFHLYFRLSRIGREHIPASGPVILASNHRSFLDPFVLAVMVRRPMYFMSKKEIFFNRPVAWLLGALGAFPIDRGASDQESMATARAILERGDVVLVFPEGTRIRPGALGRPRRGVGRLALETGAPVVPIAIIGTERIRNGWRIRPHKVRIRAGRPLTFPRLERPGASLAAAVTERIWPCVELQWEWLGGPPRLRRAAVVGATAQGTSLAAALARAGLEVDLGVRPQDAPAPAPDGVVAHATAELELGHHDLVAFAVPAHELPAAVDELGARVPARAGVLALSRGLVPLDTPASALPSAYLAEHTGARAVAFLGGPGIAAAAPAVVAARDPALRQQLATVLRAAAIDVQATDDVTGAQLAATAGAAAALAAEAAAAAGPAAAGAAAGRVFAEVDAYARRHGARPGTFAGLAGTGDLVATLVAHTARDADLEGTLPLLARTLRADGVDAAAVSGLVDVVQGRVQPERWAAAVIPSKRERRTRAA
jgi:glycerol-3-phosphate dehydrogenase (NAD(P)+)